MESGIKVVPIYRIIKKQKSKDGEKILTFEKKWDKKIQKAEKKGDKNLSKVRKHNKNVSLKDFDEGTKVISKALTIGRENKTKYLELEEKYNALKILIQQLESTILNTNPEANGDYEMSDERFDTRDNRNAIQD